MGDRFLNYHYHLEQNATDCCRRCEGKEVLEDIESLLPIILLQTTDPSSINNGNENKAIMFKNMYFQLYDSGKSQILTLLKQEFIFENGKILIN